MRKNSAAIITLGIVFTLNLVACGSAETEKMTTIDKTEHKHTNHLIDENSPYLLAHAHNPVNWYPWGDEALAKSRDEDKPIFLSIGYAACHWCHVMERESFENEEIASVLNEYFISIKVDREQRPDLDEIYMSFTTAMTGSGGWPMSVFLTPDLKPFFAGTYFPPEDRYGRPGFKKIITQIGNSYRTDRESAINSANGIFLQMQQRINQSLGSTPLDRNMIARGVEALMGNFDHTYGGFGSRPKFPHAQELSQFLRYYRSSGDVSYLQAAEKALKAMANGGIFDHVGGGFARYSTDQRWLVPHFEKMLYDNSMLTPVYVEAFQITADSFYLDVVRRTLDFMIREMTNPEGGFYSALDADSEGEEGKFYVWSTAEIERILGVDKAKIFNAYYNASPRGNFEGHNILNLTLASERVRLDSGLDDFDEQIAGFRSQLLEARSKRVRPLTDDKILASWNGLALSAFCKGYQVTGDNRYLDAARKNAEFINREMYTDGLLTHSYRDGRSSKGQFLEDYGFYIRGLLDLYETDYSGDNHRWLRLAITLADRALLMFMDENGSLFLRPADQKDLVFRPSEETDGAIPSPGSFLIKSLFRLNRITGKKNYYDAGLKALNALSGRIRRQPGSMTSALSALDYYFNDKIEIVLVGKGKIRDEMLTELYRKYIPNRVIAFSDDGHEKSTSLFEGRQQSGDQVLAYVCRNSVCDLPATSVEELRRQLEKI